MQFQTKIIKYKDKFIVKIPKHISKAWGIHVGDKYETKQLDDDTIFVKFHKYLQQA